jgi:hypothetical protein
MLLRVYCIPRCAALVLQHPSHKRRAGQCSHAQPYLLPDSHYYVFIYGVIRSKINTGTKGQRPDNFGGLCSNTSTKNVLMTGRLSRVVKIASTREKSIPVHKYAKKNRVTSVRLEFHIHCRRDQLQRKSTYGQRTLVSLSQRNPETKITSTEVVRFEVFRALTMKNTIFWDVTPCGSCRNRRFGGMYRHNHQGDKNLRAKNNVGSN